MIVSEDILKKLEEHVNMIEGKGEKYVYYISDPDCPFCQRFSPMLKEWAKKNNVQIKVILYPLPIHPKAKPKSIAMVCDGKGYDDIHADVSTKNQCQKGKEAIEKNLKFLQEIGVSGTPTIIGMNGRYIVGLPRSPEELNGLVQ
jgi:thiol:disulfide interchange protein DsbC